LARSRIRDEYLAVLLKNWPQLAEPVRKAMADLVGHYGKPMVEGPAAEGEGGERR
jgi:hypothetical protein